MGFFMDILLNDKDITVVIKEPSLLSQLEPTGNNIISKLNDYYGETGDTAEAFPIHRLDRGVGGVMVFAKHQKSAAVLSKAVADRTLDKEYLAVVIGSPEENVGVYKDLLFKDSSKNRSFVVQRKRAGVREASLEYRVIDRAEYESEQVTLVLIKLHTGRTHQIRVQFSSRKTPLFGDRKYGGRGSGGIGLWSYRLTITHPVSGRREVYSKLPSGGVWDVFDMSKVK